MESRTRGNTHIKEDSEMDVYLIAVWSVALILGIIALIDITIKYFKTEK